MQVNSFNLQPIFFTNLPTFRILYPSLPCPSNVSGVQVHPSFFYSTFPSLVVNELKPFNSHQILVESHESPVSSSTPPSCDWIKEEVLPKLEIKQEAIAKKEEYCEPILQQHNHLGQQAHKKQITKMLTYILNNLGRVKETDLSQEKANYANEPILVELFEALVARYSSTFKTKDEILKYITRKAFATIRNNYKQKNLAKGGPMSETLCKRYFKASSEEIGKLGIDINHRENFLQVLFPYRKNCKNKARYKDLIGKLGSSKEFYEDYCVFLTDFAEIMQVEKERKIAVFVPFLYDCVKRNQIQDVAYYKRIPWLDTWIRLADITAQEISVALRIKVSEDCLTKKKHLRADS